MLNIFLIPDKEKNYQGYMVYVLTIIWSATIALVVSTTYFMFPGLWLRYLVLLLVAIFIGVFNLALNRLVSPRVASWSLPITVWLVVTITCYTAGGIQSPHILTQMTVILTAAFLLGWKGGLAFTLLTAAVDFGYAYMAANGILPEPIIVHTPISRWVASMIPFGTILVLQYYATNHLRTGLSAMQREMAKRKETEKIKDETLYAFNERVKELQTLYAVSHLLQNENISNKKLYDSIAYVVPLGWQYPDVTAVRICIAESTYSTDNFTHSGYSLQAEKKTTKGTPVSIEVVYLKPMPELDEGPFLKEERSLINSLADIITLDLERKEHTAELQDYKYALDIASIVSISNVDGQFTFVNDNFCKVSGYTHDELLGENHNILWSGVHPPEYFDELGKAMQNGKPFRGEFINKAKDGHFYWGRYQRHSVSG